MSDAIVHKPFDFGLGVTIGDRRDVAFNDVCHVQVCGYQATLIYGVRNAPTKYLVICFEEVETLCVLDETWSSNETDSKLWQGIDDSFARTVEGHSYPTSQSLMNEIAGPIIHYLFCTGGQCVDVLARDKPKAKFVGANALGKYNLDLRRVQ